MTIPADLKPADAVTLNWVDRYAPAATRPYLRLARFDRPIGTWLLLWPCWWSVALALEDLRTQWREALWLLVLFAIGSVAMRGAGCTYNDIVDRDIDAKVERTRGRPIPSGAVSVRRAWLFLATQCIVGLAVLVQFNRFAILLGVTSLALIAIYPFMKRITYWPQAVLGLVFNWGALMGWAAIHGELTPAPLLLYAGAVLWTVGYDTIYAHQDKEDDALIGVKSTALKFGETTKLWLGVFYATALLCWAVAGYAAAEGAAYRIALVAVAVHLAWQVWRLRIDDPLNCLHVFRSNRDLGALTFAALVVGRLV